jgi:hypothetical protein
MVPWRHQAGAPQRLGAASLRCHNCTRILPFVELARESSDLQPAGSSVQARRQSIFPHLAEPLPAAPGSLKDV